MYLFQTGKIIRGATSEQTDYYHYRTAFDSFHAGAITASFLIKPELLDRFSQSFRHSQQVTGYPGGFPGISGGLLR